LVIVKIAARQLFYGSHARVFMKDGSQKIRAQQLSKSSRIDAIALVANFQQGILPWITDQNSGDLRLQQGVQPGRAGAFLEGHVQTAVQATDKREKVSAFVSRIASITTFPVESSTATEIVAW